MSGRAGRLRRVLLALGAVAIGAVAVASAPETEDIVAPFAVRGEAGERVDARVLGAEVTGVRTAEQIAVANWSTSTSLDTEGVWLLVDATVTVWQERQGLSYAAVRIGGSSYRTFGALPGSSLVGYPFDPGVAVSGSLVFELPREALELAVRKGLDVEFAASIDPRLDTVPVVHVDGRDVTVEPLVPVQPAAVEDQG